MIPHHHFSSESGATQMRFQRLIFAVILACGVTACAKSVTGVTHTPPPLAYVRYINAVSDTFSMDLRAVDQVTYSQPFLNVAYRGLGDGNYQGYQAGSRHVRVFLDPSPANNGVAVDPIVVSTVMADTTYTFTAGTYYTVVHVGSARAKTTKLWIIQDALPTQSAASVQYRIINVASVQGAVDVYVRGDGTTPLSGTPTLSALASQSPPTSYLTQAPGPLVIRLTLPGTLTAVGAAAGYTLQPGTPGTTAADPIYGSLQGGSILTAFVFDATPAGKAGPANTNFATLGVVYFPDVQPARTTSP
jgi:hypothetical protein